MAQWSSAFDRKVCTGAWLLHKKGVEELGQVMASLLSRIDYSRRGKSKKNALKLEKLWSEYSERRKKLDEDHNEIKIIVEEEYREYKSRLPIL